MMMDTDADENVAQLAQRPRNELTEHERELVEQHEMETGPFRVLREATRTGSQVLVLCRSGHKLLATVKAFDRHCNLVLENVKDLWTETPKGTSSRKQKPIPRERFISKMFLRGDSVVLVLRSGA